jgi:hypothetical protein
MKFVAPLSTRLLPYGVTVVIFVLLGVLVNIWIYRIGLPIAILLAMLRKRILIMYKKIMLHSY